MSETHVPIEQMEFFGRYVAVADAVWEEVGRWRPVAADTVGKQLVRAVDSIGANLVEGDGRFGDADALHFLVIARASARETCYWIQRAVRRKLVDAAKGQHWLTEVNAATQMLNALIRYRRAHHKSAGGQVREPPAEYLVTTEDPFAAE